MWEILAFSMLGFFVGNMVGLTGESIVQGSVAILFAFAGGSAIAYMKNFSEKDRIAVGKIIFSLSLFSLFGVYVGILMTEHRVFGEPQSSFNRISAIVEKSIEDNLTTAEKVKRSDLIDLFRILVEIGEKSDKGILNYKYLRGANSTEVNAIEKQLRNKQITYEEAYLELKKILLRNIPPKIND